MADEAKYVEKPEDCPEGYWCITPGARVPWLKDGYQGPEGLIGVVLVDKIPEGWMIFVKDHIVIEVWGPEDRPKKIPETGTYDAIMCHPASGPSQEDAVNIH